LTFIGIFSKSQLRAAAAHRIFSAPDAAHSQLHTKFDNGVAAYGWPNCESERTHKRRKLDETNYSWKIHNLFIENSKFIKRKNLKFGI